MQSFHSTLYNPIMNIHHFGLSTHGCSTLCAHIMWCTAMLFVGYSGLKHLTLVHTDLCSVTSGGTTGGMGFSPKMYFLSSKLAPNKYKCVKIKKIWWFQHKSGKNSIFCTFSLAPPPKKMDAGATTVSNKCNDLPITWSLSSEIGIGCLSLSSPSSYEVMPVEVNWARNANNQALWQTWQKLWVN